MQFIDICANFAHFLLPQSCVLCGSNAGRLPLCSACKADLPTHHSPHCPVCALPTPQSEVCGACLHHPPAFDATVAAFTYAFPMDALLRALKYREQLQIAKLTAECIALKLENRPRPDLVIPMPLHPHRLRERGFNQAAEIARHATRLLDLQLDLATALRVRATEPQAGLPLSKRTKNMRGAFAASRDLTGKRIAVIDDVMTSGASLNELAKTLK